MKVSRNWKSVIVGLTILLLVAAGCTLSSPEITPTKAPETEPEVVLRISGSGTTTAVLRAVTPAFEADTPGYRLETLPGAGTGGGVQGVIEGILDVAAMARPPKDAEAAQNVKYTEFGQSGVSILAHPDVGVTNLTTAQIAAIFSGEITNWSKVGGPDLQIVLCVRDEGDSSTKALRKAIFGDTPFAETTSQVLTSQSDMQTAVAGTPGSVGFGSWPSARASGADVRAIAFDGVAPGDSTYPIVTPMGIGYLANRQAEVQPLNDWLLSEQGQAALQEFDVIIP